MQKRFLAIFAMIATVFAFGIGAAMAAPPAHAPGPPDRPPACDKDDAPDWCEGYEGKPGDRDGDDGDGGGTPPGDEGSPLDALCDALGAIDPAVADVCQQIVDALTGGGGEFPPPGFPPGGEPGGEPSCADIPVPELAAGCQQLVDALTGEGGGGDPGGEPSCADIPEPQLAEVCQQIVDALTGGELPEFPPSGDPGGSPLDALCDALGEVEAQLGDACQQIVDALTGGGGEFPPPGFPPGGDGFDCSQLGAIPEIGGQVAEGCEELLANLPTSSLL